MAIWKNTTVEGFLEVTEQYLISDHNYNLADIKDIHDENGAFNNTDFMEIADDRTNTRLVGQRLELRAGKYYADMASDSSGITTNINIHTVWNGDIDISAEKPGNINVSTNDTTNDSSRLSPYGHINLTAKGHGDINLTNKDEKYKTEIDSHHFVLHEYDTYTWGTSNPSTNNAKVGQVYFKIIT